MLYRVVRTINDWYALTLFWVYLGVFLLACALVFVFPLGPILLLFAGLASLGFAVLGAKALRSAQTTIERHSLARGRCPSCQAVAPPPDVTESSDTWQCDQCGAIIQLQPGHSQAQAEGPDDSSRPSRRTQ